MTHMKRRLPRNRRYTVTDGKLVLNLQEDGRWFIVTSPMDPSLMTQARSVQEAFEMARDALKELRRAQADLSRWLKSRNARRA